MKNIFKATGIIAAIMGAFMLTGAVTVPEMAELGIVKNYILNGGAERGTYGWATFKDAAATTPVDGTGGSPSHITLSASSSSPLKGNRSLRIINSGSTSAQGEGASYDFAIDSGDQASVINVSFDYSLISGTFVSGSIASGSITDSDLEIYVYDKTNSVLIQPSGYILACGAVSGTLCSNPSIQFQAASNSTSYRLIFYVPTTHTNAWTMAVDNIVASRQAKSYGSPAIDAISYVATYSAGFGTVTNKETWYSRHGDRMRIWGSATAGTVAGSVATITLPAGYSVDTTKVPSSANANSYVGRWINNGTSAASVKSGDITVAGSGTALLLSNDSYSASLNAFNNQFGSALMSSSATFSFFAEVPITGWSSNVQMSDSADTRVVAARMTGATATVTSSYSDLTWTTIVNDTHAAMGAINYTVQVSGYYAFQGQVAFGEASSSVGQTICAQLFNTTSSATIAENCSLYFASTSNTTYVPLTYNAVYLNAGTQVKIQVKSAATSPTITNSATLNFFSVTRISGPSTIAATESVNGRYYSSVSSITGSDATVTFATKDFDSHGAYSGGTLTIPVAGKYQLNSQISITATGGHGPSISIYKNGSQVSFNTSIATSGTGQAQVNVVDIINCVAGDLITIKVSDPGTSPSVVSSNVRNWFSWARVGN